MTKPINTDIDFSAEEIELKQFSRSVAELEWLLLVLVLLYFVAPGTLIENSFGMVFSMCIFALFVLGFHYTNFSKKANRGKLAIETMSMILFISWVLFNTGGVESDLLNLYLLVIITSAITLGKVITMLQFILITCIYFYLGSPSYLEHSFSIENFSALMAQFAPFLLVGYLTTMLSGDINYGKKILQVRSDKDELTGLLNRGAFNRSALREATLSKRYTRPYSILMIDADNLKKVNDQHGHDAGDRLITSIADNIQLALRKSDILARFGGDEFIALLPESDIAQAIEVAVRIRLAINNTAFDMKGKQINSTVSIGVASYPGDAQEFEEVCRKADEALYYSKNQGRNQVQKYAQCQN